MIHSSYYRPKVLPVLEDLAPNEIDRLQDLSATATLNRTKIEEIGRDGIVDWKTATPTVSVTMRQLEYGTIDFWRELANKGDSVTQVNFSDFKTPLVDIAGYKTDDSGTFLGTIYYPGLRTASFGVSAGDPDALMERSFTLSGEDEIVLLNNNKYLIYKRFVASGGTDEAFTLSDPVPYPDPDNSGDYLFRVARTRANVTTEILVADWSYDGAGELTVNGTSVAGDVIRVWYSATTYISGVEPFIENDADLAGISADSCSVYLESSNYLYRLQSASLEVTLDRYDVMEIGNKDKVAYGTRDITTRVTLGRMLESYTIEEVLRGKAGQSYGKIDVRNFSSNLNLIIKIYSDNTKTNFLMGYKCIGLAPTGTDIATPTSDYINRGVTLEGEEGFVTTVEGIL